MGEEASEPGGPVDSMTDEEKLWCLDGDAPFWAGIGYLGDGGYHKSPFRAAAVPRLGLPGFAFSDGPRGVVVDRATCFPVSMARGAAWDPGLEERIGEVIGMELRAVGADLFGGVCVNVLRHPAWGRAQETYGEDPFHVGEMGAALARGVQRHAMACVKHFACNSMENARFAVDVTVDEVALHEVYLPHFKRIVDEGVAVVMSAYNRVNGEWCGESRPLLTDVLRGEWGFEGFVISDWIFGLRDAARSLHAGLDVEMPYRMLRAGSLPDALAADSASWDDVEIAAGRVVATRQRFGSVLAAPRPPRSILASPGHRALAREAAARSIVLLRNEAVAGAPVLPLDPSASGTVALVGALATAANLGDSGSSDVWAPAVVTIEEGLRAALPHATLTVDDGSHPVAVAKVASEADAAVVVVGYTYLDEGEFMGESTMASLATLFPGEDDPELVERFEASVAAERTIEPPAHVAPRLASGGFSSGGDRTSLRLRPDDVALVRAVAAANPRTVVVLEGGSAVLTDEWDGTVPAVVHAWYPGMEGGHGVADVLTGAVDASGRLPFSVPRSESDLPEFAGDVEACTYDAWHGYWHLARQGTAPAYPFGFGLSYTTFALDDAEAEVADGAIRVRATVHNTGQRPGSDVVQVYARRREGARPERLVAFARVAVGRGERVTAELVVGGDALAERDVASHATVVRPGRYELRVARHAGDEGIACTVEVVAGSVTMRGEER